MSHVSVLLDEVVSGLDIHQGDVCVDCTLGDAGHSLEILKRFGDKVTIIGIDRDQNAIDRAQEIFGQTSTGSSKSLKVFLKVGNFKDLESILKEFGFANAQRFIFDLGFSSRQIEESGRGFSFKKNEPLLMTFEKVAAGPDSEKTTARNVVNDWSEENLFQIIKGFGEERFAKRIARGIVEARATQPIETTFDLVNVIMNSTPSSYHRGKIHPATRTFQAIRIAVNNELETIKEGLRAAWKVLSPGGRITVIAFHSLEDRIVKQYFNELKKDGGAQVVTKRPIIASDEEIQVNPRSRSAKLRIIKKLG